MTLGRLGHLGSQTPDPCRDGLPGIDISDVVEVGIGQQSLDTPSIQILSSTLQELSYPSRRLLGRR